MKIKSGFINFNFIKIKENSKNIQEHLDKLKLYIPVIKEKNTKYATHCQPGRHPIILTSKEKTDKIMIQIMKKHMEITMIMLVRY